MARRSQVSFWTEPGYVTFLAKRKSRIESLLRRARVGTQVNIDLGDVVIVVDKLAEIPQKEA